MKRIHIYTKNGEVHLTKYDFVFFDKSRLHREDGPAIIHADGYQEWYLNGEIHRTDGPAMIHADGKHQWYLNGELHRTDGPAVIHADDSPYPRAWKWCINGTQIPENWFKENKIDPLNPTTNDIILIKLTW